MTKSCPMPTPEQRQYLEIREAAERAMLDKLYKAIDDATAEVADKFREAGLEFEPTSKDYFTFATQQVLFVKLCGGDPETLEGGDPEIDAKVVRDGQHIIDHYWKKQS
jgi:hypothetical protein